MDKYQFAELVAADFAGSNKRFAAFKADPTFWDFLMQLFDKLLPMLGSCFMTPKEAAQSALDNTLMGRFRRSRLTREVRNEIDDFGLADEISNPVVNSILKVVAA